MIDATPALRLYARLRLAQLRREDAVAAQRRVLADLLRCARNTRFGLAHGFHRLATVGDYQRAVRLRRYDDLWNEYWRDDYPVLDGCTWPGRIPYFAFTSGTASGAAKYIPVSRMMVRANRRAALEVLVHHLANRPDSRVFAGKSFILGGSTDLVQLAPGVLRGDLSGIAANEVPPWLTPWSFPPRAEALEADWERKIDRLARLAADRDIRLLSGTPNWVLAFLDHMARVIGRGPAIVELFPRLETYVHGGVGFRPYAERFAALLAGSRAETREVYPASEGFVAIADRGPGEGLRLLVDNGLFFEFVPLAELAAAEPTRHWLGNAETGTDYALALTTCAGLYSYLLGDVVRLVGLRPPRLLVVGRTSTMLNVVGEHLSGAQLEDAVVAAADETRSAIGEYTVGLRHCPDGGRARHVFVVEFATLPPPDGLAAFARRLDATLQGGSLDYRERRAADIALLAPEVVAVPPGFFAAWLKRRGRLGGQNKVPRVMPDQAMLDEVLSPATARDPRRPPAGAG